MKDKEIEKNLLRLLQKYHHYKFMTGGFWSIFRGWFQGMNLGEFMEWLRSRED